MPKQLNLNLQPAVVPGDIYLVVKESDIDRHLNLSQAIMLRFLRDVVADQRERIGAPELKCLVIEHNHPTPQPGPQALEGLLVEAIKQVAVMSEAKNTESASIEPVMPDEVPIEWECSSCGAQYRWEATAERCCDYSPANKITSKA